MDEAGWDRRVRVAIAVVVALAAFRYGHEVVKLAINAPTIDFGTYYMYTRALLDGVDPFDPARLRTVEAALGIRHANSPPTFTPAGYLVFAPFALLPYGAARLAWFAFGQACVAVALIVWWRAVRPAPVLLAAGVVVAAGFQPLFESIAVGQLGLLMLALASVGIAAHAAGRPLAAAVPLSWMVQLKPQYVFVVPLLYWLGARRAALMSVGLTAVWIAAAALVFGAGWLAGWWRTAGSMTGESPWLHVWPNNISPHAMLHRLFGTAGMTVATEIGAIVFAGVVGIAVVYVTRRARSTDARLGAWAVALSAVPLMSPLTEEHHLAVLLAPCLLLLARIDRLSRAGVGCFVAGTVLVAARYSVAAFSAFASGVPSLALGGKVAGAALLAIAGATLVSASREPR